MMATFRLYSLAAFSNSPKGPEARHEEGGIVLTREALGPGAVMPEAYVANEPMVR